MKIVTILGTRPEIIRLSLIIKKLDKIGNHILIHTGQNYDTSLNDIFMKELGVRKPDYYLEATGSFAEQIAIILVKCEEILRKEKPDRFLVLGDTNSSLSAIIAKRLHIPTYHMEAGNRCFDERVPEEVNRQIIDHTSDILLPYTHRSKENLLSEGFAVKNIFVTGNPIFEVLTHFKTEIENSIILKKMKLKEKKYFLATIHREENVDNEQRLEKIVEAFNAITALYKMPLLWSIHPRTKKRLEKLKTKISEKIVQSEPLGLFNFVKLEKNAACILTDSGTVQEEACILKIPGVILRDSTERPETVENGSSIFSGVETKSIIESVSIACKAKNDWIIPAEYMRLNVSDTVVKILFSNNQAHEKNNH